MNRPSDEQVISVLLTAGTIKNAAAELSISERALYDRMRQADFRAQYRAVKADILRTAVINLNDQLAAAIRTTAEIMNDPDNNPAIRLQAAQTIMNHAGRFIERLAKGEAEFIQENETAKMEQFDIL